MTPKKLKVAAVFFSYGGNGGISSEHPDIREWFIPVVMKASKDERVESFECFTISETPVTMSRNLAVTTAREKGIDVLIMVDSDMCPDVELKNGRHGKPFWDSSFDYLHGHYDKGPVVVFAPYCGPPQNEENVYVFAWHDYFTHDVREDCGLKAYSRYEAARMSGIHPAAAGPTGLIMYDMRCFDLIDPPYYYYEFADRFEDRKASTEDVTNLRDISLAGCVKLGYNPVFCNWDAWAGHWKPKCVRAPQPVPVEAFAGQFRKVVESGFTNQEKLTYVHGE